MRVEDLAYTAYKENPCDETQGVLYRAVLAQAKGVIYLTLHQERSDLAGTAATYVVLNLENFRGDSAFSTWSHRIARNIAYDEARKLNRRKEDSLNDADPQHIPLDTGLDGYAAILMEDISKSLEPIDAKILEGKVFGLSVAELSDQLDLTEGAVTQRWFRVKEQIATFLKRS